MLNKDGFDALTHIYDAAINPGRWKRALDATARSLDAGAIALLIRSVDRGAKDLQMVNSAYLEFGRSPAGLYYGLRLAKLQEPDWTYLSRQPVHEPTRDTDIGIPAEELDQRADYAMLQRKIGVARRLGVRLNSDRVWFDAISVAFGTRYETIPDQSIAGTRLLLPHLTKAVEIGRTFIDLRARYKAALGALNRVRTGMAVALPGGEIILSNGEARRICDLQDGLSVTAAGRLACHDPDQSAEFQEAVARVTRTSQGQEATPGQVIAVQRPSGQSPFLLDISPLKDSAAELDGPLDGALLTLIDPDRVPYLRMERFVALYGLTPAEAEVCRLIVQGCSVNDIAEIRSTQPVTAKNQVAAVLEKIGVRRRLELIHLVIRVLPPVE